MTQKQKVKNDRMKRDASRLTQLTELEYEEVVRLLITGKKPKEIISNYNKEFVCKECGEDLTTYTEYHLPNYNSEIHVLCEACGFDSIVQ